MADKESTLSWLTNPNVMQEAIPFGAGATPQGDPNAISGMISALTSLPQRALQASANDVSHLGDHTKEKESVGPAVETAMHMMGAGAPMAETNAAGMFGGKLARTANLDNLRLAESMEAKGGFTPEHIIDATGWFKHPADNKWRFEIPDHNMKLNYMPPGEGDMATAQMGQWIDHPELFKAYPSLAKIPTQVTKQATPLKGEGIYNNPPVSIGAIGPSADVAKSVLAHELMHGIQNIERFSYGASPNHYQDLIAKGLEANPSLMPAGPIDQRKKDLMEIFGTSFPLYKKTAGEVEPRNVQTRLDWSPEKRKEIYPWNSQDVPYKDQIINDPWGPKPIIKALKE